MFTRTFNHIGEASFALWALSRFVFGGNPAADTVAMLLTMLGLGG